MLYKRQFILRRILFTTLGVWRIHHANSCTFKLHLGRILTQKVFTFDIAVTIIPEDHIGCSNSKHIALEFKSVQLFLLDILSLILICARLFKHVMHRCNKESCGTTTGIKYNICSLNIQKVTEQITDMARRENNSQRLTITAGIAHKLAIESSNEIFTGTAILYVVKNILL